MGILKFRKPGAGRRMRRTYGHKHKNMCELVDTVMACKFFPGPVSRIAGMPDTAPSGAVFFIP
ncbi:hypothetical protein ACRWWQ_05650, partial [Escherichia coli]